MRSLLAPLALAGMLCLASSAGAHDSWISRHEYRNYLGEWCCGEGDCGVIDHGAVKITSAGNYRIDGFMTIGEGAGAIRIELHELVAIGEAQPSQDGEYWRCRHPSGQRRCFFVPPTS